MSVELPRYPMNWPEPWRAIYLDLRAERIAIMVEAGVAEDSHAVTVALGNMEQDLRAQYAAAAAKEMA